MAGQKPVLNPETIATAKDPVCREVFGFTTPYSELATTQQGVVDTALNDAFMEVTAKAKWFAMVEPSNTDLPTEWNELFRATAVYKLKRSFRSVVDANAHLKAYVEPLLDRVEQHYSSNWMAAGSTASDLTDIASIRKSVAAKMIRQRSQVFMPVPELDREIRDEFVRLWSCRWWQFRKRMLKVTLNTDGSVVSADGTIISALASQYFVLQGSSADNRTSSTVQWVDSTRAAEAASHYDGQTGTPRFFYDTVEGGQPKALLLPTPDQAYTAFVTVYIGPPAFSGITVSGNDGLTALPVELRGHLRDRVLANMISMAGKEDTDASRLLAKVERDFTYLSGQLDDGGPSRSKATPHHTAKWINGLVSHNGSTVLRPSI